MNIINYYSHSLYECSFGMRSYYSVAIAYMSVALAYVATIQ